MPIEGYVAFDDPYLYKGTTVLKNRLGIRDPAILQAFEVEMSSLRAEEPLPVGYFDAAQYRKLHIISFKTSIDGLAITGRFGSKRDRMFSAIRSTSLCEWTNSSAP